MGLWSNMYCGYVDGDEVIIGEDSNYRADFRLLRVDHWGDHWGENGGDNGDLKHSGWSEKAKGNDDLPVRKMSAGIVGHVIYW